MWTVIYISPTEKVAEKLRSRLTDEGFLIKVKQLSGSKNQYEILVPESELEEVQDALHRALQGAH
ncbi:SPOR domain-containing protein [Desulfuribacillus alkaliarsenatis]|uniref:Glutamate decarboxylase n=1 Tax=Desulfuribacillus alkaliarsenatis TaxID=766136 RepID=A0A1E5FYD1_9FIRM|nr:SPOR domain-containing protein [Desulfuribacillus alkaliarsenatis]OEF95579.1 glutamate decarboxylase [Desulfuribacillus alkaliarsenatis]